MMNKRITLFVSLLLIVAGILIQFLVKEGTESMGLESIRFFSGLLLGVGVGLLLANFVRKK